MTNGEYVASRFIPFNSLCAEKNKGGNEWRIYSTVYPENILGEIDADLTFPDPATGQSQESAYHAIFRWLDKEYHLPLLTPKERKYLKAVIEPWKNKVNYITKKSTISRDTEYIYISTSILNDNYNHASLPEFKSGTMFRGMNTEEFYSIRDLGLL